MLFLSNAISLTLDGSLICCTRYDASSNMLVHEIVGHLRVRPCLHCDVYNYCDICPAMMEFVYGDLEHVDEHFCRTAKARFRRYERGESAEVILASLEE